MKVLYDISILGSAHQSPRSRTGIFRVVEQIALGLKESKSCDVTLCASQNNLLACQEYLAGNDPFRNAKFSHPRNFFTSVYTLADPLRNEIAKLPQKSWKVPFRKVYRYGERFLVPINGRDIRTSDIYHSPAHSIPDQVNRNRRIAKFITIHDLIPVVCTEHKSPSCVEYLKQRMDSIKPDTFIFCVSESTRTDLLNYMPYLDPQRLSVVHLAAGDQFYPCHDLQAIESVRSRYAIPPDGNYLLGLSMLSPRKNFDRVVRSFVTLLRQERIKDLHLVLVGSEGWEFQEIYREIEAAGEFKKNIILTGYVPDEDLASLYSGAMAFVYPSLYEGFGLPPLEAMQCGTPVITSNNSSIPEVVGNAALMVDPRNEDALCQAMLDIYRSPDLRRQLSELSVVRAREFTWEKTVAKTIAVYRTALQTGRP